MKLLHFLSLALVAFFMSCGQPTQPHYIVVQDANGMEMMVEYAMWQQFMRTGQPVTQQNFYNYSQPQQVQQVPQSQPEQVSDQQSPPSETKVSNPAKAPTSIGFRKTTVIPDKVPEKPKAPTSVGFSKPSVQPVVTDKRPTSTGFTKAPSVPAKPAPITQPKPTSSGFKKQ